MNRSSLVGARLLRGIVVSTAVAMGCFASMPAHAADAKQSLKYAAWAKFKPGSSSTVSADVDMKGNKIHISMTKKLVSVDDEKVVIESKTTVNVMGHDRDTPATTETISAKDDKEEVTLTGEKEISAMDKTFKCKVYEVKAEAKAKATPAEHGRPGMMNMDSNKATVYTNTDVPGGVVRLETQQNGKDITFVLTATESK